jgi:uncharacterized protein (TIGR03067 family)
MKSLLSALWLTATVAATATAGPSPEGDLARLQGLWTARAGPRRDIQVVLEVEGHRARVRITPPHGPTLQVRGELTIDETTAPRALTWTKFVGLDGVKLPDIPAIYEVQGDAFRVCNGGPHGDRPAEFKAGDGVLADLLVFERPKPESRPADSTADRSSTASSAAR